VSNGPPLHAVVLAGGSGERFWPASRRDLPKQFLRVVGNQTLLDATLERARHFAARERIWVVCGSEHARAVRRASGLPAGRVLVEPRRRNTAMACAWAAQRIAAESPDAVIALLPADHHVPDAGAFADDIRRASRAAVGASVLVTLGIVPTRPETGYGYIRVGEPAGRGFARLHRVSRFVEKPSLARARRYLVDGGYLWNAGVFVWTAEALLREIESHAPPLHRALAPLRRKPRGRNRQAVEAAYGRAPSLPIDVAVMERSASVWTLPARFAWSDVGTWDSLAEQLGVGSKGRPPSGGGDTAGNRVIGGELLAEDARGNLVWGGKRLVVLLGVEDLAVVDTDDVIFVTKLGGRSDVRRIVATLRARDRDDLT